MQLGHSNSVSAVAVSVDGQYVVSGGLDKIAILWEASTGRELRYFRGHTDAVSAVAFSPDSHLLLTGSRDGTARLWDLTTGKELRRFQGHTGGVNAAVFSPDGRSVLTGGDDHTARLWDTATGNQLRRFDGHSGAVVSVVFSSDGQTVLTGSSDRTARLWNVTSGSQLRSFERPDAVTSVALSGDGRYVIVGGGIHPAILYDAGSGTELRRFGVPVGNCQNVSFSPDDRFVLTGGPFALAEIWETSTGKEARRILVGSSVTSIAFSPRGHTVLTGDHDGAVRIWDAETGNQVRGFHGEANAVTSAGFSPDGRYIVTASGQTAGLWDEASGKQERRFEGDANTVSSALFSTDGQQVLTGSYDGTVRLWDASTALQLKQLQATSPAMGPLGSIFQFVFSVALSTDAQRAVSGGLDNAAHLWNVSSGKEEQRFVGHTDGVWSVALSRDGKYVLTGGLDKTARLWDAASGTELRRFIGEGGAAAFSPDGHRAFTSGADNTARAWDTISGKELIRFVGHSEPVESIAISSDGHYALTGSQDTTARLWDATTGAKLLLFSNHTDTVTTVSFSPDGRFVLTGSNDATARIWDRSNGRELAILLNISDGGWVVVDPLGRFDTSDLDGGAPLAWVVDDDPMHPLPLEIFMREYYTPGLLTRILNGDKLPELPSIAEIKNRVQPDVSVVRVTSSPTTPGRVDVVVHAASGTDEKGVKSGLQDLRLFRDGQMAGSGYVDVPAACAGDGTKPGRVAGGYIEGGLKDCDYIFHDVMLKSGAKKVTFTAYAFNSERIKSATASLDYVPQASVPPAGAKPRAYLLQIGVNHFGASDCELSYSVNDAEKMSADLSERLKAAGFDVRAVKLESPEGGNVLAASKQAIHDRLAAIAAQATPDDVFFMSFSGHGYSAPGGAFYILPSDIQGSCRQVNDTLLKSAISADELADWLRPIDAGEMTLILDACFSAEGVETGDFKPGPLGSQGLGQVAYDKRMRVLAASQSDEVAHEYGYLQQGLLTYVLTHDGLDQGKADWKPVDKKIMVGEWLGYAANAVPKFMPTDTKGSASKAAGDRFGDNSASTVLQIPALFDFSKTDTLQLQ